MIKVQSGDPDKPFDQLV